MKVNAAIRLAARLKTSTASWRTGRISMLGSTSNRACVRHDDRHTATDVIAPAAQEPVAIASRSICYGVLHRATGRTQIVEQMHAALW